MSGLLMYKHPIQVELQDVFGFRKIFVESVWLSGEVKSVKKCETFKRYNFSSLVHLSSGFDRRFNCVCKVKCSPLQLEPRELEQMNKK